jgi:thiamine-phosphate diphosphorylase
VPDARLAGLFVLADDDPRWRRGPLAQAEAACEAGAAVVQLRAKRTGDREALELARAIRRVTREAGVLFYVNDRFDLALLAEADGVHLGQEDLAPARLPKSVRARLQVGRSTHTLEQVRAAREEGVDYVAFGPLFDTGSKQQDYTARGMAQLAFAARAAAPLPLVAIGGIDAERARGLRAAGAAGAAVISAVADADDPRAAARALVRALGDGSEPAA